MPPPRRSCRDPKTANNPRNAETPSGEEEKNARAIASRGVRRKRRSVRTTCEDACERDIERKKRHRAAYVVLLYAPPRVNLYVRSTFW